MMISQIVMIIMSFVTRTFLVRLIGIEAVSLNGLFTQVISTISLAEMGVGTAITYNLYKPLAEGDHEKVSELMNFFRIAYWIIGAATMLIGLVLTPWIQFFIKDISYDISYIRIIYLMFVFQSAVSYLFSYKITLLLADQNEYIYTRIFTAFKAAGTVIILLCILVFRNYLVFLGANIVLMIVTDAYASRVTDRKYDYLNKKARLPKGERKEIFANIKNIFIMQFAGRVVDSTDNILISALVGTIFVGFHSNYVLVMGFFKQLTDKMMVSFTGSMGNLYVTDETEKKADILNRLTFIFFVIAAVGYIGVYACIQSFITMWLGPDLLLQMPVVLTLCYVFFVAIVFEPLKTAMRLTGYFEIGRNISFVSAMTNLIVSIILGRRIGLVGIFLGTMTTYIIEIITKTYYLYRKYLQLSPASYILLWVKMLGVFTADLWIVHLIHARISLPLLPDFLVMGVISVFLTVISIVLVFFRSPEFRYVVELTMEYAGKFLNRFKAS